MTSRPPQCSQLLQPGRHGSPTRLTPTSGPMSMSVVGRCRLPSDGWCPWSERASKSALAALDALLCHLSCTSLQGCLCLLMLTRSVDGMNAPLAPCVWCITRACTPHQALACGGCRTQPSGTLACSHWNQRGMYSRTALPATPESYHPSRSKHTLKRRGRGVPNVPGVPACACDAPRACAVRT